MSPGERWFTMETSPVERRALFQLEKELEVPLLFEHGGSCRASPLWVAQILLGRLFCERLSVGRVVKSFAKFQRREMMRGLVKLNELEDVAEPPLGDNHELSVSRLPRDEPMDMEVEDAALEEAKEDAWFSLSESQIGLLLSSVYMHSFDIRLVSLVSRDSRFLSASSVVRQCRQSKALSSHLGFPERAGEWMTFLNFENISWFPAQPAGIWLRCIYLKM